MQFDHIVFASANKGKIEEVFKLLNPLGAQLHSATDLHLKDTEETGTTFTENALLKAEDAFRQIEKGKLLKGKYLVLADDSGLCVDALNRAPGVYTKRYAYEGAYANSSHEYDHLMDDLKNTPLEERTAHFVCLIAAVGTNIATTTVEGRVSGHIPMEPLLGERNLQYNPVFVPEGLDVSFAQMSVDEKAKYSHRARAVKEILNALDIKKCQQ